MGWGLSALQKEILLYVHRNGREIHNGDWACWWYPHNTPRWANINDKSLEKYSPAAISRAVRRLEERGLIIRENTLTGTSRNTDITLTGKGRYLTVNIANR